MSNLASYNFNNLGNIGSDVVDQTQKNMHNTRFANYMLSSFVDESTESSHVQFATSQPTMMWNESFLGKGLPGKVVDINSDMLYNKEQNQRPLEKLALMPRPFVTVPYLGRGSCDTDVESKLQQGESVGDKKSIATIMEKPFTTDYNLKLFDAEMQTRVDNASNIISTPGWVLGGAPTRTSGASDYKK